MEEGERPGDGGAQGHLGDRLRGDRHLASRWSSCSCRSPSISGIVGRLFREFGLGVAVAVLISAFVALTLTPMLCSRFLSRRRAANACSGRREPGGAGTRTLRAAAALGAATTAGWSVRRPAWSPAGGDAWAVSRWGGVRAAGGPGRLPRHRHRAGGLDPRVHRLLPAARWRRRSARPRAWSGYFSAIGLAIGGPAKVSTGDRLRPHGRRARRQRISDRPRCAARCRRSPASTSTHRAAAFRPAAFRKPLQFVIQATDLDELGEVSDRWWPRPARSRA